MIDLSTPNEWQFICPELNIIMPWYTKPALDEIVTWDLKDKIVFEYGCGASSLWWDKKCSQLYGVEYNTEYFQVVSDKLPRAIIYWFQDEEKYVNLPKRLKLQLDIIIIDGSFRDACVPIALECLKPGGKLIFDNWMQQSVELQSEETQRLLLALPHTIYKQPGHPDWQTLIATKPREITNMKITEVSLLPNGEYGIGFTTH